LLALGGDVVIAGQDGERRMPLDGFQIGPFATGLGFEEILTGFELPTLGEGAKCGYYKVNRKPGEFADAIGAVVIGSAPRVVCGATEAAPFRVAAAEERLAAGAAAISVADARDMIAAQDPGFDDYDLQIHAVALSRAVGRAFA
jgi:carbon-monoxide dehydrogenase medium subunit